MGEGMTSPQFLGIQLVCQIVPEQQDGQDEILPDSGRKTITTAILEARMSFWIVRHQHEDNRRSNTHDDAEDARRCFGCKKAADDA